MKQLVGILLLISLGFTPHQSEIQLDGNIQEEEWYGANSFINDEGYKLLIKQEGDLLYVAMSGPEKFWAHLYLWDGSSVKVMHASAALGAVSYKQEGDSWITKEEFKYEFRNRIFDDVAREAMLLYFSEHRWVANNMNLGDGKSLEMKVKLESPADKFRVAFVMANYDLTLHSFPSTLKDDTILKDLVRGKAIGNVKFEPGTWMTIGG